MDYNIVAAFIGVGSNIQPERNISDALARLSKRVDITGISTFYKTTPILRKDQDDYLNGVWQISTSMSPEKLKFDVLRKIEQELHRNRESDKYASRTIDLDILLFGDLIIQEENLTIPDPDIYKRSFIAFPLSDYGVPSSFDDFSVLTADIFQQLGRGTNVLVHCRGGVGRSGLLAAGVLLQSGLDVESAFASISAKRGVQVPETTQQRDWLKDNHVTIVGN